MSGNLNATQLIKGASYETTAEAVGCWLSAQGSDTQAQVLGAFAEMLSLLPAGLGDMQCAYIHGDIAKLPPSQRVALRRVLEALS